MLRRDLQARRPGRKGAKGIKSSPAFRSLLDVQRHRFAGVGSEFGFTISRPSTGTAPRRSATCETKAVGAGTHRRGLLVIVPKHGNTVSQSMKGQCLLERFVSLPSPTIDRRSAACGHGVSSLAARRWSRPPIRPTWLAPSHTNTDVANSASGRAEWRLTRCLRCQRRSISKKYSIVLLD
jgi:hypothetical protein